jgi:tetratricopeptide (TPR) repeat protein
LQRQDDVNKAYDRLIQGSPRSAYAYTERGVNRRDNYKFELSSQDLQRAVELNPKYGYAYSMLAKALKKGMKLPEAIKVYNSMLKNGGPNANLLGRRANCYAHTNQVDKAITDYDQAIKLYGKGTAFLPQKSADPMPKDQRLDYNKYWLERVECREQLGQIDQAINELTAYIAGALHPDSAYDIRQRLYRRQKQYEKALSDLNYLIKKEPFVGDRYTARAEVFAKLGRAAESKQDLKHAENIETTGSP